MDRQSATSTPYRCFPGSLLTLTASCSTLRLHGSSLTSNSISRLCRHVFSSHFAHGTLEGLAPGVLILPIASGLALPAERWSRYHLRISPTFSYFSSARTSIVPGVGGSTIGARNLFAPLTLEREREKDKETEREGIFED